MIIYINNKINNIKKLISRNYILSLQNFFEEFDYFFENENKEYQKLKKEV